MKVSIESTQGLETTLKIVIPSSNIEAKVSERLQKAAKTVALKGFRKGKVPVRVVQQHFGRGIRQEIVGEAINTGFTDAISKEKLNPVGQPKVDILEDKKGSDLEFTATFEVLPDLKLCDLKKMKVARPVADIKAKDIKNMIEQLRDQQSKFTISKKKAIDGDKVNLNYSGTKGGKEFEGGQGLDQDLVLGSNTMIPGFEDGIIGMTAGESKVLDLKFPKDYHAEDLKGAKVKFKVEVNSVSSKTRPKLDDEFFKLFGVTEGGEKKFKEEVESNMERELNNAVRTKLKNRVMNQLYDLNPVDVPKTLLTSEINQLKQQTIQQFGGGQKIDMSMLPDDMFQDRAHRRAALGIIVSELVKQENISADANRVKARVEEIASTYEKPSEVVEYYYSKPEVLNSVEAMVLEDQVTELVLSKAVVKEENISYEKAVQPDPEPSPNEKKKSKTKAQTKAKAKTSIKPKVKAKAKAKTTAVKKSSD